MIEFSFLFILNPAHWQFGPAMGGVEEGDKSVKTRAIMFWLGPVGLQVTVYYTC